MADTFLLMGMRRIHKLARLASMILTIVGAALGSLAGLSASMWGGLVVILPVVTAIGAILGALGGAAIEFAIRMKYPTDYDA